MTQAKLAVITAVLAIGMGAYAFYDFLRVLPWHGTWWSVQETGINWTGDSMRNLHILTFDAHDDGTVTVIHRVQTGEKESDGSLNGTGVIDGGLLRINTPYGEESLAYNRFRKTLTLPLTDAEGTSVVAIPLTDDNRAEEESIRQNIISVSRKEGNFIDTTVAAGKI